MTSGQHTVTRRLGFAPLTEAILRASEGIPRLHLAIAGPPASGKSTTAERLAQALGPVAQVIPMDGFHLDNATLSARGRLHRKGAPDTFDVAGFAAMLTDLRAGTLRTYPTFDRRADATVPEGGRIRAQARIFLIEGNYLLLERDGWRNLAPFWDKTIFLPVAEEVLRARLIQRWLDHGLSQDAARARAEDNDLPNALTVMRESRPADVNLID